MNAPLAATGRPYPLDNRHDAAPAHHQALADLLDTHSRARILEAVDGDLSAARCLEVGAGGGSIARWLADQVGTGGHVIACDLRTEHISRRRRLNILGHDLSSFPWPTTLDGPFDLIYSRLTLAHLPARETILAALVGRLARGGVILIEDWAAHRTGMVVAAPDDDAAALYERYQQHVADIFAAAGTDHTWAPRIHPLLARHGLSQVRTTIHARYWTAGGPGLRLVAGVARQLRPQLLGAGFTDHDLEQFAGLLDHPRLIITGHPLYSSSGRHIPS